MASDSERFETFEGTIVFEGSPFHEFLKIAAAASSSVDAACDAAVPDVPVVSLPRPPAAAESSSSSSSAAAAATSASDLLTELSSSNATGAAAGVQPVPPPLLRPAHRLLLESSPPLLLPAHRCLPSVEAALDRAAPLLRLPAADGYYATRLTVADAVVPVISVTLRRWRRFGPLLAVLTAAVAIGRSSAEQTWTSVTLLAALLPFLLLAATTILTGAFEAFWHYCWRCFEVRCEAAEAKLVSDVLEGIRAFDAAVQSALRHLQELLLVQHGYRLAVRLGPATRLEDHSGRTSLPGRRLRAQLRSSLRTVRTALNVALTAIAADAGGHASLLEMSASAATNDLDQDDALGIADLKQSAYSVAELRSATLCHLLLLFERIPILGSERGQETLSELLAALTWTLRNEADTIGAAVRLSFAPLPPAVDRTAQTRSSTSALLLQRVSILQHHIVGLSHKLSLLVEPWTTGDWDRVQDPHTVLLAHWMAIERDLHDAVEMGRAVHTAILDDDHQSPTSAPPAAAAAAGSCGDKVASVDGAQSTTTASDSLTAKSTGENESGQTTADDSVELVFEAYTGPLIAEGAAKKPKMSRAERIVARKAADATQRTTTPSASSSFDERLLLLRELRDVLGKRPSLSRAADDGPNNSAETLSPNGGLGD